MAKGLTTTTIIPNVVTALFTGATAGIKTCTVTPATFKMSDLKLTYTGVKLGILNTNVVVSCTLPGDLKTHVTVQTAVSAPLTVS